MKNGQELKNRKVLKREVLKNHDVLEETKLRLEMTHWKNSDVCTLQDCLGIIRT